MTAFSKSRLAGASFQRSGDPGGQPGPDGGMGMTGARILVLEDGAAGADSLAEGLGGGPFQVIPARHEAAWGLLEGGAPVDLVVLGRQVPEGDGLSALRRLAEHAHSAAWPVLWQPAAESPSLIQAGLAILGHYHLPPAIAPEALQGVVVTALADRQARETLGNYFSSEAPAPLRGALGFSIRTLDDALALASRLGPLGPAPDLLAMGLSELLINGIEHGNLGIDFAEKTRLKASDQWQAEVERRLALPEHCAKRVRLTLTQTPEQWVFLIEDQGPGFDWRGFLEMQPERADAPNGRGIALAHQLVFAGLEYQGSGARVRASVPRKL